MNDLERYSNAAFLREMISTPLVPLPGKGTPPVPDGLLSEEQAAIVAGCSSRTIRRLIKAGRLEAVDYGTGKHHNYRIKADALARLNDPEPKSRRQRKVTRRSSSSASLDSLLPDF